MYAAGNSTVMLNRTNILGAHATESVGGGLYGTEGTTINLFQSMVSKCFSYAHGGGVFIEGEVHLDLHNVQVINNAAGLSDTVGSKSDAVGVLATGSSFITLKEVTTKNNFASADAGGLGISGGATLIVLGAATLTNNTAQRAGVGLQSWSSNIDPNQLTRFVKLKDNKANIGADVSFALLTIEILDSSNASFVTSDSPEGMFRVRLNVLGAHGFPSNDPIVYTVRDAENTTLY